MTASLSQSALETAISQLGAREEGGPNRGREVDQYLAAVGLDPGYPWCAAFIFWCFRQAAVRHGGPWVNPVPRAAAAVRIWALAEPICRTANPAPGFVYVLDHGHGQGHTGIIETVTPDGLLTEISGNTNAEGSREGDCVWRHVTKRAGEGPETIHGGALLGYLDFDQAAQPPELV